MEGMTPKNQITLLYRIFHRNFCMLFVLIRAYHALFVTCYKSLKYNVHKLLYLIDTAPPGYVKRLSIINGSGTWDFPRLAVKCHMSTKVLNIPYTKGRPFTGAFSFKNLQDLNVGWSGIGDDFLWCLSRNCPHLEC